MMIEQVEISSFDLRFEDYRLKNKRAEMALLASISEKGIHEPLEGVTVEKRRILLNGFKRYRCARKLGLGTVPYLNLANEVPAGVIKLLRLSNAKRLNILEQARLVDELKNAYRMSPAEIAALLEKSNAWVSLRAGMIKEMSPTVRERIFSGLFPAYAYMYILRPFMRINGIKKKDVDEFVDLVAGRNFSLRDLELLANGYFKGPDEFRRQIKDGAITWALDSLKETWPKGAALTTLEQAMINDLELTTKYMQRLILKGKDNRYKSSDFWVQANLLSGAILNQMEIFQKAVRELYDQSGKTQSDLLSLHPGHVDTKDLP